MGYSCFTMSCNPLDLSRIRAITLDLDDTLWPIWPTIARAESVLQSWLAEHAPATHALYAMPGALRAIRNRMEQLRPDLRHDLSALILRWPSLRSKCFLMSASA